MLTLIRFNSLLSEGYFSNLPTENKMNYFYRIILFFLLCFPVFFCSKAPITKIENGYLDLSKRESFLETGIVALDGEWRFYWNQFLEANEEYPVERLIKVPSSWNYFKIENQEISGIGYATYILNINLGEYSKESLSLKFLSVSSAYRLYVNHRLIADVGRVGKSYEEEIPDYSPATYDLPQFNTDTLEIKILVSNFHHNRGGIWRQILLGKKEAIQKARTVNLIQDSFLIGSLFIIGIYHLGFFYQSRKNLSPLYFGIFCIVILFRVFLTGEMLFSYLFSDFPFKWQLRLEYIDFEIATILGILYFSSIFKDYIYLLANRILIILLSVFILATMVLETRTFTKFLILFQSVQFIVISYMLYILVKAFKSKNEEAKLFILGLSIWTLALINDSLFVLGFVQTGLYAPIGFFLFIFLQAFLLSSLFNKALIGVAELSEKLIQINQSYSRFVPMEFLSYLNKKDVTNVNLGDVIETEVAILFCDIRSFTSLSEKSEPFDLFRFLNSYFDKMNQIIIKHNGIIDKYIGDAILAIFPSNSENAVHCAIEMQETLRDNYFILNGEKRKIQAGTALHYGNVLLGVIGGQKLLQTTVISDAVNTSARLQSLTKTYGCGIIMSESLLLNLDDANIFRIRFLDHALVPGKEDTLFVCEVYDSDPKEQIDLKLETKKAFDTGVSFYHLGEYEKAWDNFIDVLKINPQDSPAIVYMNRAATFLVKGLTILQESEEKLVKWDSKWETGIRIIDEQHRMLFDIINDLHKAMKHSREREILERILKNLKMYIFTHFTLEEELMLKVGYDDFANHKKEHSKFIETMNGIASDFEKDQRESSKEILEFLKDWLIYHIQKSDKEGYVPFVPNYDRN